MEKDEHEPVYFPVTPTYLKEMRKLRHVSLLSMGQKGEIKRLPS